MWCIVNVWDKTIERTWKSYTRENRRKHSSFPFWSMRLLHQCIPETKLFDEQKFPLLLTQIILFMYEKNFNQTLTINNKFIFHLDNAVAYKKIECHFKMPLQLILLQSHVSCAADESVVVNVSSLLVQLYVMLEWKFSCVVNIFRTEILVHKMLIALKAQIWHECEKLWDKTDEKKMVVMVEDEWQHWSQMWFNVLER